MSQEFGAGDIVRIRNEKALARVVMPIEDEDGTYWYEVEPFGEEYINRDDLPHREVKQDDLTLA